MYREFFFHARLGRRNRAWPQAEKVLQHLRDLHTNVKNLFRHREVHNPYKKEIGENAAFSPDQRELLLKTIEMLTLLNQLHRWEDHWGRFHATKEDYMNGLNLIQLLLDIDQRSILLSVPERKFYEELRHLFRDEVFTAREVRLNLRRSRSTTWWKLQELMSKGLIERVGGNKGKGYLYQIREE